jgi:osmotically-inducible protein OsmY
MRRLVVGLAITLAAIVPAIGLADDPQIAKSIAEALKSQKDAGNLHGFKINLEVNQGTVWLKGHVADDEQQALAVRIAESTEGVGNVVNDLKIEETASPRKFNLSRVTPLRMLKPSAEAAPPRQSTRRQPAVNFAAATERGEQNNVRQASHDEEIAKAIFGRLSQAKQNGQLRNFKLDMNVEDGTVWMNGQVTSPKYKNLALDIASRTRGVVKVVDQIAVHAVPAIQTSNQQQGSSRRAPDVVPVANAPSPIYHPAPAQAAPIQTAPIQTAPIQTAPIQTAPIQAAPIQAAPIQAAPIQAAPIQAAPIQAQLQAVPMQQMQQVQQYQPVAQPAQMMGYPSYQAGGIAAARYDHPHLPQYAWPSYAAHANYGAVTYPQQYSAHAWPYIGPFYPYPQVPLGWRRVELKWKDGWWMLDFKEK